MSTEKQRRVVQLRVSEQDEELIERLMKEYKLDRTKLILRALEYVDLHKPTFQIVPEGKGFALPVAMMN